MRISNVRKVSIYKDPERYTSQVGGKCNWIMVE